MEKAAKKSGNSVSSWARHHLFEAAKPIKGWPDGYFEKIESFDDTTIEEPGETGLPLKEINLNTID